MSRPYFSIIIPVYNRADYLEIALDSLSSQSEADFEVLIVDDASSDPRVADVAMATVDSDSRFRLIVNEQNRGVAEARNAGIREAKGRFIAFLDSDDSYLPWTLETYRIALEESDSVFLAGTAVPLPCDGSRPSASKTDLKHEAFRDYLEYRCRTRSWWFNPSGAVVRKDVLDHSGGFWHGRELCEDFDLWQRLGTSGGFTRVHSPPIFAYRMHAGNIHKHYDQMYAGVVRIIRNERLGRYPGGNERNIDRICVIASLGRHHARELLKNRRFVYALRIYFGILGWNIRMLRLRFLVGFPFLFAGAIACPRETKK